MRKFFYPRSVVVFGVSNNPSNMARIIVENLERFQFEGMVYPVGSYKGTVGRWNMISSIEEIDDVPDLAVLLIPAVYIPETLEACARKGMRHAIIESGGFSEFSEEKGSLEREIRDISLRWGMKIIGPNCFGAINLETGLVLPFFIIQPAYMRSGPVSLISQSGGILYDTCMLASCENLGLNKLVSIGNKLLVNENECLEYLISDPGTGVIGLYLENFTDGRRFVELALSTEKPIVVLKANRSPAGREIAKFHTTALAGDDVTAQAALKEAGVHQVQSLAEMIDAFKAFSLPPIGGDRLALITRSGGHGVLSADGAHRYGFEVASLSESFFAAVKEKKINVIRATNPLDIGDIYDLDSYSEILDRALEEEGVDGVIFVVTYSSESDGVKVQRFIRHAAEQTPTSKKPVAICTVSNKEQWPLIRDAAQFPIFTDVDNALKAIEKPLSHHKFKQKRGGVRARLIGTGRVGAPKNEGGRIMGPAEVFALLTGYDLPVTPYRLADSLDVALAHGKALGYPVAIKTASPHVLHKTEAKSVVLDVRNTEDLKKAIMQMGGNDWLIQKMASPGREIIVGGKRDSEFGHILLLGLGGIFVEVFRDMAIRLIPVDEEAGIEMIDEIQGAAILKGFRGTPSSDIGSLSRVLAKVSRLIKDHPEIRNLDMNPLIVYDEGKGCTIVDAKIEVDS